MTHAERITVKQYLVADNEDTMVFVGTNEADLRTIAVILNRPVRRMANRGGQPKQWRVVTSDTTDMEFIRAGS